MEGLLMFVIITVLLIISVDKPVKGQINPGQIAGHPGQNSALAEQQTPTLLIKASKTSYKSTTLKLKRLRSLMRDSNYVTEPIEAYIITSFDAHSNEFIAPSDKRLEYVSGFNGGDGTAIITLKEAALWTDGRYFLQAQEQLDQNWILMKDGIPGTPTQAEWLYKVLPSNSRIGIDPLLISFQTWTSLATQLHTVNQTLVAINDNLVDQIWDNRPSNPSNPVYALEIKYAGKGWEEKIGDIRVDIKSKGAVALVVTALDEIAWLFNLRGSDIEYTPLFYAYSVITLSDIFIFMDKMKLTVESIKHLKINITSNQQNSELNIKLLPYKGIKRFIKMFISQQTEKIWISQKSSYTLVSLIPDSRRIDVLSPILLKKAVKNKVEIEGMKKAQIKDAVALCEFFDWLEDNVPKGNIDELCAAKNTQKDYMGLSFRTISASGPNGALIHYKTSKETNRLLRTDDIYLCDSGAQYKDGTTDITRTIHFGKASSFEKECFTHVLKGHIALALATFPQHIKGQLLDILARKSLWELGLDYLHGTGHGVGMFLNVHEGPIGITANPSQDDPGLSEGMILSDEPGYYEEGKFGIRIESLVLTKNSNTKFNFQNRSYLSFETITLIPIQTKLLQRSLLTTEEILWINEYHKRCRYIVGKALVKQRKLNVLKWLIKETEPLV